MAPVEKSKDPERRLLEAGLLLDTYGALLTDRQRQFMRLHYEEDLSFSEIAREFHISRQAVHDSVRHATASLQRFEAALGLVGAAKAGSLGGETRIAGRQLVERLEGLRRRVQQEGVNLDPSSVVRELSDLIGLLQGSQAGEERAAVHSAG